MSISDKEIEENETDVKVEDFAAELNLEILHGGKGFIHFSSLNISRPGLQLTGYYEHFGAERVQVIGEMETTYLSQLTPEKRMKSVEDLFKHNFPCLIISRGLRPCGEIMQCAKKYDKVVLGSELSSTTVMNELSIYLNELLAPRTMMHGELLDIYGVGVLMIGKSSVGKSETAMELIQRNHRLVADDAVCIKRINDRLIGTSPDVIRYMMEVRGIGIVDVRQMYGAGAVKLTKMIDLVIKLETWDEEKEYNRLGDTTEKYTILGIDLPMNTIPVKSGRNLAAILEVAARNHRLKDMGYDAVREITERQKAIKEDW